jgi:hypothetical protein
MDRVQARGAALSRARVDERREGTTTTIPTTTTGQLFVRRALRGVVSEQKRVGGGTMSRRRRWRCGAHEVAVVCVCVAHPSMSAEATVDTPPANDNAMQRWRPPLARRPPSPPKPRAAHTHTPAAPTPVFPFCFTLSSSSSHQTTIDNDASIRLLDDPLHPRGHERESKPTPSDGRPDAVPASRGAVRGHPPRLLRGDQVRARLHRAKASRRALCGPRKAATAVASLPPLALRASLFRPCC